MLSKPPGRLTTGRAEDRGTVAIVVALAMTALLVIVAMVLDFGAVRMDRQVNKASTDAATAAGLRGLDKNDGESHPFAGVCQALDYLKLSKPDLSALPAIGNAPGNNVACPASVALQNVRCLPGNSATHATYAATVGNYEVTIKSPYQVSGGGFPEESYGSVSSDTGDSALAGCDQLGIIVTQRRSPGLGSLATSADLVSRVRSVGRVSTGAGDLAPALLLLERTACGVLTVGSAGSPSRITVAASGVMPATIHSDSDASDVGCGSGPNQQLFQGKQAAGAVAHGTGTDPGIITAVAAVNGVPLNVIQDSAANVYGTTAIYPAVGGTTSTVEPRNRVTRKLIDARYLPGVTSAVMSARSQWLLSPGPGTPAGYGTRYGCPTAANMTAMASMTSADSVYIDCPGNSGISLNGTIGAGRVYFHGFIKNGTLALPNATQVYIDNTDNSGNRINSSAITLGNNNKFCVRALSATCDPSDLNTGKCSALPTGSPSAQATLMIRRGGLDATGGLIRLCNTRVILAGGDVGLGTSAKPGACLPTSFGIAPTAIPCLGTLVPEGDSHLSLSGLTDWTAPNAYGDMVAAGLTPAQQQAAWDSGEDLAVWTETYGAGSTFKMAGGGNMNVGGVFMVPNAFPFTITGNGSQDLTNAQFVTRSFAVNGGATLLMRVDPNNAVPLPKLDNFTLVR